MRQLRVHQKLIELSNDIHSQELNIFRVNGIGFELDANQGELLIERSPFDDIESDHYIRLQLYPKGVLESEVEEITAEQYYSEMDAERN